MVMYEKKCKENKRWRISKEIDSYKNERNTSDTWEHVP